MDEAARLYRLHELARVFAELRLSEIKHDGGRWLHAVQYQKVLAAADVYLLGTSHKQTIFWQVDEQSIVRTGKVISYDPRTGKRVSPTVQHGVVSLLLKIMRYPFTKRMRGRLKSSVTFFFSLLLLNVNEF